MTITITDTEMTSGQSPHAARLGDGGWEATWLPGRSLTRDQAITAMTLAEAATPGAGSRVRLFADGWAAELGLTGADALALIAGAGEGR